MLSLPKRTNKPPKPLPRVDPGAGGGCGRIQRSRSFSSDTGCKINRGISSISLETPHRNEVKSKRYGSLSPSDISNQLKDELPLQLVVSMGAYGENEESTFAEEEQISAHFIQNLEYVLFRLDEEGIRYRIPLNSKINACPIYNPKNNLGEALKYGYFFSPKQLMVESTQCPLFVTVVQGHADEDSQHTVEVNDVLFVSKKTSSVSVNSKKKSVLQCTHILSNLTKFIKQDSKVVFSTRPSQLLLPLSNMIKYMTCPSTHVLIEFPVEYAVKSKEVRVGVFLETGRIKNTICSRAITFSKQETKLFVLPENFDLELAYVRSSCSEQETLCAKSAGYFKNFNPANVSYDVLYSHDCKTNTFIDDTQLSFYNTIIKSNGANSDITCPPKLRRYFPVKYSRELITEGNAISVEHRVGLLEKSMQTLFTEITLVKERLDRLTIQQEEKKAKGLAESAFDMVVDLNQTVSKLQKNEVAMNTMLKSLTDSAASSRHQQSNKIDQDDYQSLIPIPTSRHTIDKTQNKDTIAASQMNNVLSISEINRQYLMTLTLEQVSKLLENLGMKQHVSNFKSNDITGNSLAMLRELDLIKLSVLNQNERSKLVQFISGEESAFSFIMLS